MSEVEGRDVEWLWPGRVAIGKVSLIAGDPGLGKSLDARHGGAGVAGVGVAGGGAPVRNRAGSRRQGAGSRAGRRAANHRFAIRATGSVLLLSAEDDLSDTIRPRLEAAGADCERIVAIRAMVDPRGGGYECVELARDLKRLARELVAMPDCRLVVVDPLSAYLGQNIESTNAAVRRLLTPLSMLAAERQVAVVVVTHLRKRQGTGSSGRSAAWPSWRRRGRPGSWPAIQRMPSDGCWCQ